MGKYIVDILDNDKYALEVDIMRNGSPASQRILDAVNIGTPYEEKQKGEWSGKPERRKMVTRVCTACGERSAVGYYCMWCGAYDGVSPRRDEKEGEKLENDRRGIPGIPEEK